MTARHLAKGRWSELLAQAHFIQRGWTVFAAVHHFGLADLVVVKPAGIRLDVHLVEVKYHDLESPTRRHRKPLASATAPGVKVSLCHVSSDGTVACDLTGHKPRGEEPHGS